jgi:phage tail sheath protein FI
MAGYQHGMGTREEPTSITPAVTVDPNLPFVVGTAPVDKLPAGSAIPVNVPLLFHDLSDFVATLGWYDDSDVKPFAKYTLCEAAETYLSLYGASPIVVVNVFDPATHQTEDVPDPLTVTAADIIGGVDPSTLKKTGLELINEVFTRFRLVPGNILCPKFSEDPAVAVVMAAKSTGINTMFRAISLADISPVEVTNYTLAPGYKNTNNLNDTSLVCCYPHVALGDKVYHLSSHQVGVQAVQDDAAGGVPYVSPSNKSINITRALNGDGNEMWLDLGECNYLNGQGIVTVSNFIGGWKLWGNRTSVYPSVTDPKDSFIAMRRLFNWLQNTFLLTHFSKVDNPLNRRQIQSILDSEQIRLDGFTSQEILLGGRIEFLGQYNPLTDLLDGMARFKHSVGGAVPNRYIESIFEFDPYYLNNLFS